jgi:molecular chaperone GrpE
MNMNPTDPPDFLSDEEVLLSEESFTATPDQEDLNALRKLASEAEEYKAKYLRNLAEMENAKKRLQKERGELIRYANEQMVLDLLPPLDHLENALRYAEQSSAEVKHWAMGFSMILQQLKDAVQKSGAQPFSSEGEAFDPHLHEAVEVEISETVPEGIILQEFVKGYRMGDRVIRPARVKVSRRSEPSQNG